MNAAQNNRHQTLDGDYYILQAMQGLITACGIGQEGLFTSMVFGTNIMSIASQKFAISLKILGHKTSQHNTQ